MDRSNRSRHPGAARALVPWIASLLLGLGACSGEESAPGAPGGSARAGAEPAAAAEKPVKAGSTSALLAYQTGIQFLIDSDPGKARENFERAIELDPTMAEAHFELGKLITHLSTANVGSVTRDRDVLERGIAELLRAHELQPKDDDYAYWVGRAYDLGNDKPKAIQYLKLAVELDPTNAAAHKRLGMVYLDESEIERAQESFAKAVEHDPADGGSHYQLGQVKALLGDQEGARDAYRGAIEAERIRPEPYQALAQVLARLGDEEGTARAEADFKRWSTFDGELKARKQASIQNPKDPKALLRVGEMYFVVQMWSEANEWFLRAVRLDPTDPHAHLYCGIVYRNLGQHDYAKDHLKEAEFLAPDSLDPKLELVRLYAGNQDEKALQDLLGKVEQEAGADAYAMRELGLVCDEIGRPADAKRLLEKAVAADGADVGAKLALAVAADGADVTALLALAGHLREEGALDAAHARYRRVLALDPENDAARAALTDAPDGEAR